MAAMRGKDTISVRPWTHSRSRSYLKRVCQQLFGINGVVPFHQALAGAALLASANRVGFLPFAKLLFRKAVTACPWGLVSRFRKCSHIQASTRPVGSPH